MSIDQLLLTIVSEDVAFTILSIPTETGPIEQTNVYEY